MSFAKSLRHKIPRGSVRGNKYGAIARDGFPSKLEARTYDILLFRQAAQEITGLCRQTRVELTDAKIACKIDFSFIDNGVEAFAEAKGVETERWVIIKKLWRYYGPGNLEIWVAGTGGEPRLQEIIRR